MRPTKGLPSYGHLLFRALFIVPGQESSDSLPEDSLSLVYFVSFEGFAVASSMEGSALLFIPTFSAIDLPSFCLRGREENFVFYFVGLCQLICVRTLLFGGAQMLRPISTEKTCLTWRKQYTYYLAQWTDFFF